MAHKLSAKLVPLFLILSFCMLGYVSMSTSLTARMELTGTNGMVAIDPAVLIEQNPNILYSFASDTTLSNLGITSTAIILDGQVSIGATTTAGVLSNILTQWSPNEVSWSASSTASNATVAYSFSGLSPGLFYLSIDGSQRQLLNAPVGATNFSYSGPWSTHTFEISVPTVYPPADGPSATNPGTSNPGVVTVNYIGLGAVAIISISILVVMLLLFRRPRGSSGRQHR